ncbi:N-6 DNA methylase [Streptomyces halobius]|uniref:SAM-dependent methyltransferase n=1 Tax=Streptomyces halobius TaxID=2879846 RepID=A0ABY4M7C9_9ACTN|nr:N-6 DNA methylase [Streptomyces halobius]UQA93666.1 SAM-dependent methyltransferase [Streptomyces halobius]
MATAAASPARSRRVKPSGDPHGHAMRVGEAVAGVWHRQHGGTRIEVPIGLVAALALIRQKDEKGPDLKAQILAQDDTQLIAMFREIWSTHWIHRPDLIDRARILHEWLNDEEIDDHRAYLVRAVTKAALDQGLFDLTGHAEPYLRGQTDVLSPVMMLVRSSGAQQGLGEYHTPADIADAMANVLAAESVIDIQLAVKEPQRGEHIHDPAAGSGGLLRSAAQRLRERGLDPADFQWSMVDIDEIAAACAAVNSIIWSLGPRVTVACADSIANPNAVEEAMKHARAVFAHRDETLGKARIIAAVRQAQQLLEQAAPVAA